MIRVLPSDAIPLEADAILRSVSSEMEALTGFGRELERRAGAGPSERLRAMGELPVGAAVITPGGDLAVPFIIHVVLQSADEPVTPGSVRAGLKNGLRRAEEWSLETLAMPALGSGAGNLDAEEAAALMVPLLWNHLRESESPREVLILVGTGYEADVFSRAVDLARGTPRVSDRRD